MLRVWHPVQGSSLTYLRRHAAEVRGMSCVAANMKIRIRPALPSSPFHSGSSHPTPDSSSINSGGGGSSSSSSIRTGGSSTDTTLLDKLRPRRRQQQKQRLQLVLLDHGLYRCTSHVSGCSSWLQRSHCCYVSVATASANNHAHARWTFQQFAQHSHLTLDVLYGLQTLAPEPFRRLDDEFRLQYARMWQALVMADERGIRSAAAAMGAGEMAELFAGVLTQRPWSQVSYSHSSVRVHSAPVAAWNSSVLQDPVSERCPATPAGGGTEFRPPQGGPRRRGRATGAQRVSTL